MKILALKMRSILLILIILLSFSLISCDKISFLNYFQKSSPPQAPELPPLQVRGIIIAKINNFPITIEDLNEEVENYNNSVPEDKPELKITTREQKIDYLKNEMVRRALLYQEAKNRGLESNEEIRIILEKTKMDLLVMELVRQETEKISVTNQEIEGYYDTYKDQLKEPEERRIREIAVPTEAEAREVLIQLLQGADFATLAIARSLTPSGKKGGDLGFIQTGTKFPQFDAVAFSETLEAGKVSNIFMGPDGYYIVKLEAKRGGEQKSLSEMREYIEKALTFLKQQQRIEDIIGKISRETKIEIYEREIQ